MKKKMSVTTTWSMGKLMCCATMFAGKVAKAGFELPLA
jgi:hypothetical protein